MATFARMNHETDDDSDDEMPTIADIIVDEKEIKQDDEEDDKAKAAKKAAEKAKKAFFDETNGIEDESDDINTYPKPMIVNLPPPSGAIRVAYVFIPCNESILARTIYTFLEPPAVDGRKPSGLGEFDDPLQEELRGKFNVSGSEGFRSRYMEEKNENATINSMITSEDLTGGGPVEIFPLTTAGPSNAFQSVNIYLDCITSMKSYPPNKRLVALAESCGLKNINLNGDVYLARKCINPKTNRRELAGFTIEELEVDSKFIKEALQDNSEYRESVEKGGAVSGKFSKDVSEVLGGGGTAVATGEGYVWTQDEDEVEITIIKPDSLITKIDKRSITTKYSKTTVLLKYDGAEWLKLNNLFDEIDPDGCMWQLSNNGGGVVLTIEKAEAGKAWPSLLKK